jgi:hypothetical protein
MAKTQLYRLSLLMLSYQFEHDVSVWNCVRVTIILKYVVENCVTIIPNIYLMNINRLLVCDAV